jgi:electron transfer flavoprotein beta subunit
MNHVVCIAYVPDTETKIKIGADGRSIEEADVKWIVSPYDEYALEEAIKAREAKGGTVTVVTYGPARADVGLRECLARGADEAVRIASDGLAEADSLGVAQALAGAVKALPCDVLWLGNKGVGTDAQVMVPMLAELLDLPHANLVTKIEWKDGALVAYREIEGAREVVEMPFPCVVGAQKGLNEPRYPKVPDIMKAKKKEVKQLTLADLGLSAAAAQTELVQLEKVPDRTAAKVLPGPVREAVRELVRILKQDEKVI